MDDLPPHVLQYKRRPVPCPTPAHSRLTPGRAAACRRPALPKLDELPSPAQARQAWAVRGDMERVAAAVGKRQRSAKLNPEKRSAAFDMVFRAA